MRWNRGVTTRPAREELDAIVRLLSPRFVLACDCGDAELAKPFYARNGLRVYELVLYRGVEIAIPLERN